MRNISEILEAAAEQLCKIEKVSDVKFEHVMDRYFSVIYEITADKGSSTLHYILKIGTTSRSSRFEHDQYLYLQSRGVRSLIPVHCSDEFNFLITRKENLQQFDEHLKGLSDQTSREKSFFELGVFFKDLESRTGGNGVFSKNEFEEFTIPRLKALSTLPKKLRDNCTNLIKTATTHLDGSPIKTCFISDFSLGNIHLDHEQKFVMLDLGDSSTGHRYWNISYIRLNSLYGSLNHYVTNYRRDNRYFDAFQQGYQLDPIHNISLNLHEIMHLIMMISFASTIGSKSRNSLKRIASHGSNWYLCQRYTLRLRKAMRQLTSELP